LFVVTARPVHDVVPVPFENKWIHCITSES
jgi:hypothetical protein